MPFKQLNRRRKGARDARRIGITAGVLLVLVVGGLLAYTYFVGQTPPKAVALPTSQDTTQSEVKHVLPGANAQLGVAVEQVTSDATQGSNASLTVHTLPTATCSIVVTYPSGPSKDSGLASKVADDFGIITWAWTVDPNVPDGKVPIVVTCTLGKKSAVVDSELDVSKTQSSDGN